MYDLKQMLACIDCLSSLFVASTGLESALHTWVYIIKITQGGDHSLKIMVLIIPPQICLKGYI